MLAAMKETIELSKRQAALTEQRVKDEQARTLSRLKTIRTLFYETIGLDFFRGWLQASKNSVQLFGGHTASGLTLHSTKELVLYVDYNLELHFIWPVALSNTNEVTRYSWKLMVTNADEFYQEILKDKPPKVESSLENIPDVNEIEAQLISLSVLANQKFTLELQAPIADNT